MLKILVIKRDSNCIKELLSLKRDLENNFSKDSSIMFDYYYLLGRAYDKKNNNYNALEFLYKARNTPVINNVVIISCLQ